MAKDVLGIDFDGVIHRYGKGDLGSEIYDIPTPGVSGFLKVCMEHFDVHIVSSRASTSYGVSAIQDWMLKNNLPVLPCSDRKPSGEVIVIIDDRAWLFDGTFPSIEELLTFKPWWKKRMEADLHE